MTNTKTKGQTPEYKTGKGFESDKINLAQEETFWLLRLKTCLLCLIKISGKHVFKNVLEMQGEIRHKSSNCSKEKI